MAAAGWRPSDVEDLLPITARPTNDLVDNLIAEDHIPTIDQADSEEPPPASYRDWSPSDTVVKVYTTNPERYPRDIVCSGRSQAMAMCKLTHGRVLEANYTPERFFLRVKRGL